MFNSHRGNKFSGSKGKKFGKDSGKRSFVKDSGRIMMHETTCYVCGNKCEVPFKPSSGKPIFCNDCFKKGKTTPEKSYGKDSGKSSYNKPSFNNDQFEILNDKLDRILKALSSK